MSRNVEIKARVQDATAFKCLAEKLSDSKGEVVHQRDTFFHSSKGRLKLRQTDNKKAELVFYIRANCTGPKLSEFTRAPIEEAELMLQILTLSNGIRGLVEKKRTIYMAGETRIHVDEVKGLGEFMELEVVLSDDQTIEYGSQVAANLMKELQVNEKDLVNGAYMDLLEKLSS